MAVGFVLSTLVGSGRVLQELAMNSHVCVLHFRSGSGSAQLYNTMLTVYLEPASTSQLSSLSTAHSSWRYTATVRAHPHCLWDEPSPDTCHNIWGMLTFWPWGNTWLSTQAGWYNCAGVWWAEHTPYYIELGCMFIDTVICEFNRPLIDILLCPIHFLIVCPASRLLVCVATDMQPPLLEVVLTVHHAGGDWFSCCITSLASFPDHSHVQPAGWTIGRCKAHLHCVYNNCMPLKWVWRLR